MTGTDDWCEFNQMQKVFCSHCQGLDKGPARDHSKSEGIREPVDGEFPAKHAGVCWGDCVLGGDITPGQMIVRVSDNGHTRYAHAGCES